MNNYNENVVENTDILAAFERLLLERTQFELQVYDFLVDPVLQVPNEFWDPVIVKLPDTTIEQIEQIEQIEECIICTTEQSVFKKLKCCDHQICKNCFKNWFDISVKCPFCKFDLREL